MEKKAETAVKTAYTPELLGQMDRESLIGIILGMQATLISMNDNLAVISEQLASMKARKFGRSSEKGQIDGQAYLLPNGEIAFFFNETEACADESPVQPDTGSPGTDGTSRKKAPKKKSGAKEDEIRGLPRIPVFHTMDDGQLADIFGNDGWKELPEEIQYSYRFTPAELSVEEHHIGVYASRKNDGIIVKADHPRSLLHGSLVSPSIEAAIINSKFVNSVPYYRIEQEFLRYGIGISRGRMANWTIRIAEEYLGVLYGLLKKKLLSLHVVQADETHCLVTKDGRPAGAESWMWVYRSGRFYNGGPVILYEYQRTRKASHPMEFLRGFSGICTTDGYEVYHGIEKSAGDIRISGCWAHARRRFSDAVKAAGKGKLPNDHPACQALALIRAIYEAEGMLKDLCPAERLERRQSGVRPLVDAYFAWVKENRFKVGPKSKTGEGMAYSLNQEEYLRVFLEDGEVSIDNNATEQSIRNFVIGRKNFVLIDTVRGAEASAMIYSLVETAKANGLRPYEYFEYILSEMPAHMEDKNLDFFEKLLPCSEELPDRVRKPKK